METRLLRADVTGKIIGAARDSVVGEFRADLLVSEAEIVELKTAGQHNSENEPQLLNELRATGIEVGLLINSGRTKAEFNGMVF